MPWWAWLIIVPILLVLILALALVAIVRRFRRRIQAEFIEYLAQAWPRLQIIRKGNLELEVHHPDGVRGTMDLRPLHQAIVAGRAFIPLQRIALFDSFLKAFRAGLHLVTQGLQDGADTTRRILPRLVTQDFFRENPDVADLPRLPLGSTGLSIVCVLDNDESVMYLGPEQLHELGHDFPTLLNRAMENLRRTYPPEEPVRSALASGAAVLVEQHDSYDAVRLLLLPEALHDGESLLAAIPNRDTLAFAPDSDSGRAALGPILVDEVEKPLSPSLLKVTPDGIDLA